jgi:chromodomain-helicase-DNA-binding protein 1
MILDVADDIVEMCTQAVDESSASRRAKADAGEALSNAQKSRAVLVTYKNVGNINAETVVSRNRDLKLLHTLLSDVGDAVYDWSLPVDNIRPVLNWSGRWGPQEDAMLLVGAFLYGFGNWEAMQKDPKLGLEGKFFLEEAKKGEDSSSKPIPNAIHLVRRGDFLLGILREHDEKYRSYENSMKRKVHTASPTPVASSSHGTKRRADSEISHSVDEGFSRKRKRRATPTFTDSESSDEWYVSCHLLFVRLPNRCYSPSMDEAATKEELRPVKKQLKDLKLSGEDMPREKKVAILKDSLSAIGRRIEAVLKAKAAAGEDAARWKRHLWTYVIFSTSAMQRCC